MASPVPHKVNRRCPCLTRRNKGHKIISGGHEMTMRGIRSSVDGLKALAHPARLRVLSLLRGVMSTPAMVVDGVVKIQGQVPSVEALAVLLG